MTQKENFKEFQAEISQESQSETSSFTASHYLKREPTDYSLDTKLALISQYILQELENISGFKVKETDVISRFAIDSVKMMMFISKLEDQFQCSIDLSVWFGLKNIQIRSCR